MEDKILKALASADAMKAGDIATAAGVSKDEAVKVIKKMVKEGKVYQPKACFYAVKK